MFTPASLISPVTSASAPGVFSMSMTRSYATERPGAYIVRNPEPVITVVDLVLIAFLAAAAGTFTSVASGCYDGSHFCTVTATYTAAPGVANDVSYHYESPYVYLHDAAGPVVPGRYCQALDAQTVRCGGDAMDFGLGDGNDRALPIGPVGIPVFAEGGQTTTRSRAAAPTTICSATTASTS